MSDPEKHARRLALALAFCAHKFGGIVINRHDVASFPAKGRLDIEDNPDGGMTIEWVPDA